MLQPLPKLLLSFRRQAAERRIILQFVFLFCRRHIFVATKPIPCMASGLRAPYLWPRCLLPLWRRGWGGMSRLSLESDSVRPCRKRRGASNRHTDDRQPCDRQPIRPVGSALHFSFVSLAPRCCERSTDSLPRPAARPDHPATRSPSTSHDSSPESANRSLQSPALPRSAVLDCGSPCPD